MRIGEIKELAEQVSDDPKQRKAVLRIIDIKIESDMEKILDRMEGRFGSLESKLVGLRDSMNAQFKGIDAQLIGVRAENNGTSHKVDGLQKIVYGTLITIVVGLSVGLILAIVSFFTRA